MENYLIIDTETIGLQKPFIYDIGYIVIDNELNPVAYGHFILEQVYKNQPLFETAYYKEKKPLYTSRMKGRTAKMKKVGHAMMTLSNVIKRNGIKKVFAYNVDFDINAFDFTSKFFKVKNPLEKLKSLDIQSLANHSIHSTESYKNFAKAKNFITEKGYLKCGVEQTYQYIKNLDDYKENHIGLDDAFAELEILKLCENIFKRKPKLFIKA